MILLLRSINKNLEQNKFVKYAIGVLLATILHFSLISFISISNIIPDVFIILVVWGSIKEGRLFGIFMGFAIGIYIDFISGDTMGINALSKTIVGFIAGSFHRENTIKQITNEWKFLFVVFLCAIAHNLLYFLFLINTGQQSYFLFYLRFGLASAFYTTFISVFLLLSIQRKFSN